MPALRDKRKEKFAQNIAAGMSLADAREQAGYARNRAEAWRAQQRSDIARRIDEITNQAASREARALERAAARYQVTTDRVVAELARIAFANTLDYWTIDSNGEPQIDLSKISRDQGAAISEIIVDRYMDGKSADAREVKRIRIKLADKRQALVDLGRHLGLFVDPSVMNVNVANYFTEKPPTLQEWKHEIELQAKPGVPGPPLAGKTAGQRAASTAKANDNKRLA